MPKTALLLFIASALALAVVVVKLVAPRPHLDIVAAVAGVSMAIAGELQRRRARRKPQIKP